MKEGKWEVEKTMVNKLALLREETMNTQKTKMDSSYLLVNSAPFDSFL